MTMLSVDHARLSKTLTDPRLDLQDHTNISGREACGPFLPGINHNNLSTNFDAYDHCDEWDRYDTKHFEQCIDCLRVQEYQYLANCLSLFSFMAMPRPIDIPRLTKVQLSLSSKLAVSRNLNPAFPLPSRVTSSPRTVSTSPIPPLWLL